MIKNNKGDDKEEDTCWSEAAGNNYKYMCIYLKKKRCIN